jgi:hypothetical protein
MNADSENARGLLDASKAGQRGYRGQRDESCTERDGAGRFHHVAQNGVQFETCESFISGIFPFNIFGPR